MTILKKNNVFRTLAISAFFNKFGAAMYNLVFVAFAATIEGNKLAVGIANIVVLIPVFFTVFIGIKADETIHKTKWLIHLGFVQAILFMIVAFLTASTTWIAFSVVCFMNVISDIISDYRGGLELPIFQHNVEPDDLMSAHSFNQFISYICNIGGQAFGVWLLSISNDNFFAVATINAIAFLLSTLVLLQHRQLLTHPEVSIVEKDEKTVIQKIKETYTGLKDIFQSSENVNFNLMLLAILLINGLCSGFVAVYNIYFLERPLWQMSFSQSIFAMQMIVVLFSIIGLLTPKDYFAKQSLTTIILIDASIILGIAVNNAIGGVQLISMGGIAFIGYLGGKVTPKVNSMLMTLLPSDMLARSGGFLSLLFMLSMPIGNTIFTVFSLISINLSWILYALLAFIVFLLCLKLYQSGIDKATSEQE